MTRLVPLVLLVAASAAPGAPVPKGMKAKTPTLDGRWETVERINRGKAVAHTWMWEVSGEQLVPHSRGNKDHSWEPDYKGATLTFATPDPTRPDEFDYRYSFGGTQLVYRGRIMWDGDEWTFCFGEAGAERPAEVKAGKDVYLLRFKRAEEKK